MNLLNNLKLMNKEQTLKIIEVLDKLVGAVDNIHCDVGYTDGRVQDDNIRKLSDCADIISALRQSVSTNDIGSND